MLCCLDNRSSFFTPSYIQKFFKRHSIYHPFLWWNLKMLWEIVKKKRERLHVIHSKTSVHCTRDSIPSLHSLSFTQPQGGRKTFITFFFFFFSHSHSFLSCFLEEWERNKNKSMKSRQNHRQMASIGRSMFFLYFILENLPLSTVNLPPRISKNTTGRTLNNVKRGVTQCFFYYDDTFDLHSKK